MHWKKTSLFLLFLTLSTSLPAVALARITVFVSILPQEYFVERVGGERVQVQALVQPGQSPVTYAPTPRQMAALSRADVYFRIGVPFENSLIPKLQRSIPHLSIIDLRQGLDLLPGDHDHEGHGAGDEHVEDRRHDEEMDPHTWLDPRLVKKQAALIRDTLIRLDPEGKELYQLNYETFAADLEALDRRLREVLAPLSGQTIYVFHPAYGYFCRAYGLRQKAVAPGGKGPGPRHLARLIASARKDNVHVIFVQPQFSSSSARVIARAIDGVVIPLDPLARDYLANMERIAGRIAAAFSPTVGSSPRRP
ncbi:cation ABC transporter substrate-binding protein [Desulfolithobacter dissulfuricans]|uniref:Cation ABC transporter substrate-binding protein n=1 Tax=Desulfolithobacter dissulfuricans TaxID=2795293 RepID=A0A915XL97_9BACT|nr:zinc ABC transporter substrate-binding protein [Desulfolithobacter dissulfuricans]BCO10363.1 cation ABC transporter substrate-binding protein [Desulfolithobacter dissulfuricans]